MHTSWRQPLKDYLQWLLKPICIECQNPSHLWATQNICLSCWSRLFATPDPVWIADQVSLHSALPYQGNWRKWLIQAKFKQDPMAMVNLLHAWRALLSSRPVSMFSAVVGIPSHPWRTLTRGGCLTHTLCQIAAEKLQQAYNPHLLQKSRWIPRQQKITDPKARRKNVHNAFLCQTSMTNTHVLLIDDVCTTGATLSAAIDCLQEAGARSIQCMTLARCELEHLHKIR